MKSQTKKQKTASAGRPPTYKEVVCNIDAGIPKTFFEYLKEGEKVMLSFMAGKTKIQIGLFVVVKMKGYIHKSGADGSTRKLKPFNRAKFVPTKQFKEIIKTL